MSRRPPPRATAVASTFVLLALTACGDARPDAATAPSVALRPASAASSAASGVVIPVGVGPGSLGDFANAITAAYAGRASGPFYDNLSADRTEAGLRCNIGHFALGTMDPGCINEAAGSYANRGTAGQWADYFGNGSGMRGAAGFRFAGGRRYVLRLLGSWAGNGSDIGWFTGDGTARRFTTLPAFGAKTIGTTVTIDPGPGEWGLWIRNAFNAAPGGCRTEGAQKTNCTDATGGFSLFPYQQFALMTNVAESRYLVGVEDNDVRDALSPGFNDGDYNDYIISVTPEPCDFMTFGRLVATDDARNRVVVSGNAGGNAPGGGILGTIQVQVNGVNHHVSTVSSYGSILDGPLATRPNARVFGGPVVGAPAGTTLELRLWDDGEPGRGADELALRITGPGVNYTLTQRAIDQGNAQYHASCRGPG